MEIFSTEHCEKEGNLERKILDVGFWLTNFWSEFLSQLYLVKLSDSNLTFNLTFQFKKCKNIVGNSDPNMSTLATFTICKCPNFWSGLTCTKLFWEGSTDLERFFQKKWKTLRPTCPFFSSWPKSFFSLINLIVHLFQNKNPLIWHLCIYAVSNKTDPIKSWSESW